MALHSSSSNLGASPAKLCRRVLRARLLAVSKALARAGHDNGQDPELIHGLRVAARRALATLSVFHDLLPGRERKWWKRQCKRIRQSAGAARDQDVLTAEFEQRARAAPNPAWQTLLTQVAVWRREAQEPLEHLSQKLTRKKLSRRTRRLVARVRQSDMALLPFVLKRLEPQIEAMLGPHRERLDHDAALHRLRIKAKRIRYSLEVLAAGLRKQLEDPECPAEVFRSGAVAAELTAELAKMQKLLGDHQDHVAGASRLELWRDEAGDADAERLLDELIAQQRQQGVECRREFFRWWTPERRVELEARFAELRGKPK
jgi:CHAD domain-containing protein